MKLFQSNRMTELAGVFCERNSHFDDPFEPLTVVVQSFGLGGWLKLQLADRYGISANVDCVLPATYLWRLYRRHIPDTADLNASPFDREQMVWRIMRLLDTNPRLSKSVTSYLDGPGDRDLRLFQLADELAALFDAYLMYRPEWVLAWQAGRGETFGHEAWQAELWRLLIKDLEGFELLHRAALHARLMEQLQQDARVPESRLSVFGLSTMPPLQMQTFEALSRLTEVDVYFLNPCEHYWGDIVSGKDMARRSIRGLLDKDTPLEDEDYLEVGNPLLASLGKQGREYFEQLLESPQVESIDLYQARTGETALDFVKNDILNLTFGGEFASGPPVHKQPFNDNSLQVHSCHSPMREVEVLKDELLRRFDQNPNLRPVDVIVMVPDITTYSPYIQAVFADDLPFRIADQSSLDSNPLITTFLDLLNLPNMRLTSIEIMDLLEIPAVMRRFELTTQDLDTIAHWIRETGIRWEIDGQHKAEFWQLPAEPHNSWRFGLDRLLLGFAMTSTQGSWAGTLAHEISTTEADTLSKLGYFIDRVDHYRYQLRQAHTADSWVSLIAQLISDFLTPVGSETLSVSYMLQATESVINQAVNGRYEKELSRDAIAHAIGKHLADTGSNAAIISGAVTFANLVPMRSIPFNVVCLLGMNDGEYPRDKRPHSFDLIANGPHRRGDRSRKLDDRYLFLEALLSADQLFYLSYVGKGIRDNQEKPPSVVVSEWLNYLDDVFDSFTVTEHALQPFNRRYFVGDRHQSYNRPLFEALTDPAAALPFVTEPLHSDTALEQPGLESLAQFFRNPARFFLQQRLGVYLESRDQAFDDSEAFELDPLSRYQLADQALVELVNGRSLEEFRATVQLSGQLLPGQVGDQHLEREISLARAIFETVDSYLSSARELRAEIALGNERVPVVLNNLHDDRLIRFRVGALGAKDKLQAWIMHLAANLIESGISTIMISRGQNNSAERTRIAPIDSQQAETLLGQLLSMYNQGCSMPLFLPPQASELYMQALSREANSDEALSSARRRWLNDMRPGAEKDDRYWQRLFPTPVFDATFAVVTERIWSPLTSLITSEEDDG